MQQKTKAPSGRPSSARVGVVAIGSGETHAKPRGSATIVSLQSRRCSSGITTSSAST